jgi:transcriptional regulator with XRE-family HTH domain
MVEQAMRAKGWSQRRLGAEVGILSDGRIFDSTQIRLIIQGRRRYYDTELVERLIHVLGLPKDKAWYEAGVWPGDLDLDDYQRLRALTRTGADKVLPGYHGVALPGLLDLDPDLIRRTRVERRRRDRRRRRPWIVPIELEKVAA